MSGRATATVLAVTLWWLPAVGAAGDDVDSYVEWEAEQFAIAAPLGGRRGDPVRGRELAVARNKGNCLACHRMPIPEQPSHGNLGPPLAGVASRLSEPQLRLRIVDEKMVNPATVMPGFYRHPRHFNRPLPSHKQTLLSAQEVEDVVAYLTTLR